MSPVSRGRKGTRGKRGARQRVLAVVPDPQDPCDCPACSGEDFDLGELVDRTLADLTSLVDTDDPLEAEMAGAMLASIGSLEGGSFQATLVDELIPQVEARASDEALALLLAVRSMLPGPVGDAASAAAVRLVGAGHADPVWAADLDAPLTVTDCRRVADTEGTAAALLCSFERAGRGHAFMVSVDEQDCGAAERVLVLDGDDLPELLEALLANGRANGFEFTVQALEPAEFRWHVERALEARAVHDEEKLAAGEPLEEGDEDAPPYPLVAALLRQRINTLPAPTRPAPEHGAPLRDGPPAAPVRRGAPRQLAKRGKAAGAATAYQLKIGLRDAKPPIWRRLEVPADVSLAGLHEIIQIAFGWDGGHLHVFETPYGEFGQADADLGYRADASVTLEQVAPAAKSEIVYRYDFGDNWEHRILVEKVLDRDDTVTYPRCTGGRRAAPPDDCGGIWGYEMLVEVLADPAHPDHADRLEWMGLDDAGDFDPAAFDAAAVSEALARRTR